MHDMLPRKPTTAVPEIKKGFKDSLYVNGMNTSASPALTSPAPSGGSTSPGEDGTSGMSMKSRSDSPHILLKKKNDDRLMNSSPSCISSMMPKPLTSSAAASPLSSPGIGSHSVVGRTKTSPKHKLRRNESADLKLKNQIFNFENNNSVESNFCANNNNNSKRNGKFALQQRQRRLPLKVDEQPRASSRNSVSDELSSNSLTPTMDEQAPSITPGQNLDSLFDNVEVSDDMFNEVLSDSTGQLGNLFPDAGPDLPEFDAVVSSFQNPDQFMFDNSSDPLRTLSQTGDLSTLEGSIINSMDSTHSSSTAVPSSGINSSQGFHSTAMPSSASPTSFQNESATSDSNRKMGKSHLQDILGVTDTIRLKNMSRPIDSVPYTSPTTTTPYSTGMKPLPTAPCTMALSSRLPNMSIPFNKPRPQQMFNNESPMFRSNSQGFMDNGANGGSWSRGSPRNGIPHMMKSPQLSAPYVENSSVSPSGVNPMSGLQSTVDSIPAAPHGLSEPGTPIMGPPLGIDATPSPGGGKMRPPPSPSVTNDKRCVSADSVSAANNAKKCGGKRERTRSADSKDEEKKETSVPKNKRRKSRIKDENTGGKKSVESKTPGRNLTAKEEKLFRHDSALSGLLDVQTNNPYLYIFNTDVANKAAENVNSNKVPDIILFHQSFLGNCKLPPSEFYNPKMPIVTKSEQIPVVSDSQSMSMPTTSRSPTEICAEKSDLSKSPKIDVPQTFPESIQSINLEEMKPPMLPPPVPDANNIKKPSEMVPLQPMPGAMTSHNGNQEELSAEKQRQRVDKLDKIRKMQENFRMNENQGEQGYPTNNIGWSDKPGPMQQYRGPMGPRMQIQKGIRQEMKELPISASDGMMRHSGAPGQMMMHDSEWHQLVQMHNAEKRRRQEAGMTGDLPSRPPPPYEMNGPWMIPEGYSIDHRMQMEQMNHPRLQRINSGHRPMLRLPQDPTRMPGGYMPQRMAIPRGPYSHPPNMPQQRVPVYDQYMGARTMRHPTRLPHPAIRQGASENYPFSEQLMKQARYYNTNMPPYQPEPGMGGEWTGPEGAQRLTHMPGSSPSPVMGPQVMMNPMEVNPRVTPGMPTNRGYDHMGPYTPEMGHPQRYDMMMPMGSPTGPMDARMRGPSGVGSMMDAIARRGVQRPPDLNLNAQLPPTRSPMNSMNYHAQGPMPSPSVNPMNPPVGPHFCNPGEMGHPPQPSPMQACTRSPSVGMGQSMGPASAGVDPPSQMMMVRGAPHSAGPLSNPPQNDWPGANPNMQVAPTVNSNMMHRMMTPHLTNMASQPGMMSSQPGMMTPQQPLQQPGMMSPPVMMSQPGMMTSQPQVLPQMLNSQAGKHHRQSTLSIMMDRMNTYKMPEKSPLYQDAVKDTASPPLMHPSDPSLGHIPMRMSVPNHPPTYDTRIGHPRMIGPQMGDGFQQQGYPPRHPSPMSGGPMPGSGMMMNPTRDSMPPPCDYRQQRPNFPEIPDFDLRNILPSERPSQTISYLPPENNNDQFSSPGWGMEGIRPQLMPGPTHPTGPGRPLI